MNRPPDAPVQPWRPTARHLTRRRTPPGLRAARRQRWSTLSWRTSVALFLVPLALALATAVYARASASEGVVLRVTDAFTADALAGARVEVGGRALVAGDDGTVEFERPDEAAIVTVGKEGYEPKFGRLEPDGDAEQAVALRPNTVEGTARDAATGNPIPNAAVRAVTASWEGAATTTGADGAFRLTDVPADARVRIEAGDYGVAEQPVGQATRLDFSLTISVVTGRVTDPAGAPLPGATVRAPSGAEAVTGPDGAYRLTGAAGASELVVSAPGFAEARVAIGPNQQADARLQPQAVQAIKAVYANYSTIADPARWGELIRIADETEINAIVVDVKQDTIYYDTQVPFFRDLEGVVTPIFDPTELLAELDAHGIYAIARMVVFKDPLVAERRPDLAVKDEVSGGVWRDHNGAAWVNAFNQELWRANADLAAELATLGFDEVQYDYIRFPSDGDLTTADFGPDYSEAARRAAITGAVRMGSEATRAAGAKFAIDLFAIVALFGDDQGIGQTLQDLTPLADYVCLMVYPSHYSVGNVPGVEGHPNDYPAETVTHTLEQAEKLVPGSRAKMRPWLQDFTHPLEGYSAYGPAEVRAQIDAAEALGVSGWMLWDAAGQFEESALVRE